jgi:hypothetical protein
VPITRLWDAFGLVGVPLDNVLYSVREALQAAQ